jgi:ECF transporter S component (folate family)
MSKTSIHTRRIVLSALFLAIALVLRTFFRLYIPMFGESGMRLSIHGIFSIMPSILFGPVYGAMVSGLTDMLGHFVSPSGSWLPQLTLMAALGGFIRGWLWILLKKLSVEKMRVVLAGLGIIIVAAGGYHVYAFRADGITRDLYRRTEARREAWEKGSADAYGAYWRINSARLPQTGESGETYWRIREEIYATWGHEPGARPAENDRKPVINGTRVIIERYDEDGEITREICAENTYVNTAGLRLISRLAVNRSFATVGQSAPLGDFITFTTVTAMGIGGFLLLLLLIDFALRKFLQNKHPLPHTMALVLAMMIPAILVSTVNTLVFRQTIFTSWQVLPFFVVWLPRVLQSVATTTLNVFFVALLIGLCEKQPTVQGLLRK